MVFACLSLTTTPCRVRFGMCGPLLRLAVALLRGDGLDTCDVAASFAQARGVFQLTGGALETQVEALLLQVQDGVVHLVLAHRADIAGLHFSHGSILTRQYA